MAEPVNDPQRDSPSDVPPAQGARAAHAAAGARGRAATPLTEARRVVVKVGSALLADARSGRLNRAWLKTLIADLLRLRRRGQQVILVSSGAVALGRRDLGLSDGALRLEESQAAAAVGQIRLAHAYKELLEAVGVTVAQILLTLEDSEQRPRYLNARATLEALLRLQALPVINENDTVATAELRYGDNDRLAARVAQMASADCLVLLSDVEGLYTADPNRRPDAQFIERVLRITPEIEAMGGRSSSAVGSGGMATKIAAARIAVNAGCHLCIASGHHRHPIRRIEGGARCTWFIPSATPLAARKQWIAGTLRPAGALHIDAGALRALRSGKSLLPAGVTATLGRFESGDTVSVLSADGAEVARGISAYSDSDAARIIGRQSGEIEELLGFRGREEMIHRDDLVILHPGQDPQGSTTGTENRSCKVPP
ncbi:MAG TPA: glutamate 5-kinase [Steroidobacteraceae bacterium]|nr:glutamate 5-kinase [Steroidobacteraceae bacterium]